MFRNRELRQFAVVFFCIAAVTVRMGFALGIKAGLLSVFSSAVFGAVFFSFTKARYQRLSSLSEQIDQVVHNPGYFYIEDEEEGELSILQSEITKMTLRIREQNEALKKEKEYLADSLADIAHQLRTPLTSANLLVSLLEKNPEESDRKELLREMAALFAQMEWLTNSLLKLSRLDAGIVVFQNVPIDVKSLLHAAVRPLLFSMELHSISVTTEVPDGMVMQGDIGWLSEAIRNILKNCMQSTGDGGRIEITGRDTPVFSEITIHDNGAGFEKEDLPHLFERFYRGKNEDTAGYGIGLALCKRIITRHGGTITAKNHPHGGAVFSIRFLK